MRKSPAPQAMPGTLLVLGKELLGKCMAEWTTNEGVLCAPALPWDLPNSDHAGYLWCLLPEMFAKVPGMHMAP